MSEDIYELKRKGELDEERLEKKIREAVKKDIRKYITEEAIITGDGKKKVKIPIKGLELPEFKFGSGSSGVGSGPGGLKEGDVVGKDPGPPGEGSAEHAYEKEFSVDEIVEMAFEALGLPDMEEVGQKRIVAQHPVFKDIRRAGPIARLDLKRTLKINIARNALAGKPHIGGIIRDDLRFKSWEEEPEYAANALVIAMMDVSGSMTEQKKYFVRITLWWIKRYLERLYEGIAFEFIIHDTKALLVDEEMFFNTSTGGGTYISTALEMALDVIESRYSDDWNIYPFYFSDGENWDNDNNRAVEKVNDLIKVSRMFYYGQVGATNWATFKKTLEQGVEKQEKVIIAEVKEAGEIAGAIEKFLHEGARARTLDNE
jgi:sporulation protein YhbH